MTRFRPFALLAAFFGLLLTSHSVAADTIGQPAQVGAILDIGKDILSTVTINYNLIYGLGAAINGILFLLIALILPKKTQPVMDPQAPSTLTPRKRRKQRPTFPWKKCFTLIGLILLVIGISLISLAALA